MAERPNQSGPRRGATAPGDEPLRADLLSVERLAQRARELAEAQAHTTEVSGRTTPIEQVLERAGDQLSSTNARMAAGVRQGQAISPAIEWLLDNYYLVDEQVRAAHEDLPRGYGAELPRLTAGPNEGFPRIWEMALALVAHTDSRVEADHLDAFVAAFQEVSPLTIGETWAIPIVLRVALVENLRRLSLRVLTAYESERSADRWADTLLTALQDRPADVDGLLRRMGEANRRPVPAFLIRLSQRMGDQETDVSPVMRWIESALDAADEKLEALVQAEHQRQAADQVSIANAITAVRFINGSDWREFFERTNMVEAVLREDPAGVYAVMDFDSRDRYRHALESLAKRSPIAEVDIARACVKAASEAVVLDPSDTVSGHVGYYLISGGRYGFELSLSYRPKTRERAHRSWLSFRETWYWGLLAAMTVLLSLLVGIYATGAGANMFVVGLLMFLSLVPLSELSLGVVNRIAAVVWPPRQLPKLESDRPIAEAHRALVVVSALFTSRKAVRHVLDNLELHYLANTDPNIHFAILADLKASKEEHDAADDDVLEAAVRGCDELNETYGEGGEGPFHLFIRGRTYDDASKTWQGWERKRGAVDELCRYLRGDGATSMSVVRGEESFLPGVTFVIALDTDTVLPRDAARKLVSTIAHPLNRAQVDEEKRIVTRGYGLVQPRVGMSLESATATPFASLHTGPTGIDPYAGAISDVYQDVFGEGSFTGKGIFEVDVYNLVLAGRMPDNTLLSHDMLEGCFLRVGLASDVEVLDDYPGSYAADASRHHRWTRGDWQIIPWLGATAPGENGTRYRNPLRPLHKWKILDNLRRTVFPASVILLAATGWALVPKADWVWAAALLIVLLFDALSHAVSSLVTFPRGIGFMGAVRPVGTELAEDVARAIFTLAVLPHQALMRVDAGTRALWRQFVSHRRLLEWTTAAEAELWARSDLGSYYRMMALSVVLGIAVFLPSAVLDPEGSAFVLPIAVVWALGPLLAWHLSRPLRRRVVELAPEEAAYLRRAARKTWRFFEEFVTPEDHFLAPDNYQEDPNDVVAHRTSPTNMGLQLISGLTAHDLGYLSIGQLVERTSRTMETMVGLPRYRGHFYNWYDTLDMTPLRPEYVSAVDSGNLAGHLLALRIGLLEASESPVVGPQTLQGLSDTVRLALEDLLAERASLASPEKVDALRRDLEELLRRMVLSEAPVSLGAWWQLLHELKRASATFCMRADEIRGGPGRRDASRSVADVADAIAALVSDLEELAPWASHLNDVPTEFLEAGRRHLLSPLLDHVPSIVGLAEGLDDVIRELDVMTAEPPGESEAECELCREWSKAVAEGIRESRPGATLMVGRLRLLAGMCDDIVNHTDFNMLYDPGRDLFSIGYNVEQGKLDNSYYDMLASECRLASYLAVVRGEVPQEHWFRLSRQLTRTSGGFALLSWSASMFEYLMPLLVMRSYPATLLQGTYDAVVRRQVQYGAERRVPWGVSESAFNAKDASLTYQYQAFGVPGLGLKRGLSDDVVVAPYATMLALMVDPPASVSNLRRLSGEGGEGRFGYYESLDYTPGRVPAGQRRAIVKAYMAHHQGMSLVALGNTLTNARMRERFHAHPLIETGELLLQERVPRHIKPVHPHVEEVEFVRSLRELPPPVTRSYPLADTPTPATHFLSNGRYSVMVTNAGGGYCNWHELSVSRYREDITRDCWGQFCFVRDVRTGKVWSATYQPSLTPYDDYHCILSADKAEYRRRDGEVETYTEVVVSPEDDVEVRRTVFTNLSRDPIELEITSYFEVALAKQGNDQAHRAFSNLFLETEAVEDFQTLLFTRRPRSSEEERVWGFHTLASDGGTTVDWSYETDRARFLGRLHQVWDAVAAREGGRLSNTVGPVLDPVCAIRQRVRIEGGDTARVCYTTGVTPSRYDSLALAEKYHDMRGAQRAIDLAWSHSQIELRDLGITPDEAVVYQRLASRLLVTDPYSRLKSKTKQENTLPMSALWTLGISGDHPILLVRIERLEDAPLVKQVLLAHQYWRHKGFRCDLVILNTKPSAYHSELDDRLHLLVRTSHALQMVDKPGGVYIRRADQIEPEVLNLLQSVARVTLQPDPGPIVLQLNLRGARPEPPDPLVPKSKRRAWEVTRPKRPELAFDNGYGGFDLERGEYVIVLDGGRTTPAPWINVMASPDFGTMVSEAGVGCTWALNSHENRLTTWNNDPVSDGSGELFYVRDEETGEYWSPTPLPVREDTTYVVRHGRGYSTFEHSTHGISHETTWYAAGSDPVRIARLRLTNDSDVHRSLTVTHFVEWVLGDSRSKANQRVVTRYDTEASALTAHSYFNVDFPGRVAFLACDRALCGYTASRTEFLGRNGSPSDPAALGRKGLGELTGRFHDNCGALQSSVELDPGETVEVRFLLGQCDDVEKVRTLVAAYREPGRADAELEAVREHWNEVLGTVELRTPDAKLDALMNGWALYQALSCRIWGRTALYQSSGAFGFRDQLQDVMALTIARPEIAREQILRAAAHQFEEGDVQHWWQPLTNRGVRTRFVDDRDWLPFVVADYVEATGDTGVLDEQAPFLHGPPLEEGREDLYGEPVSTQRTASVYEHCVAAIEASRATGEHGLPLMGGGDWNDGMNRVGIGGRGESVWMAWFLCLTLKRFAEVCDVKGEASRADDYRAWADRLAAAVEENAWDGAWYRRAYFDDGTPLGTKDAEECRIDAIAQAWAAISGGGASDRAYRALEAVEEKLVRWEDGLVRLLTPPFDRTPLDPGYIKGYVPGVRENGGQYTHAAVWVVMAYALLGEGDDAIALLDIINPINHALTPEAVETYRVEPYVVPADVYSAPPHVGRGGWTWYTGSASWFYNVCLRTICGIRTIAEDGVRYLTIDPCVPKGWRAFSATIRRGSTTWNVEVVNSRGVNRGVQHVSLDGEVVPSQKVPFEDDGVTHEVVVTMLGG